MFIACVGIILVNANGKRHLARNERTTSKIQFNLLFLFSTRILNEYNNSEIAVDKPNNKFYDVMHECCSLSLRLSLVTWEAKRLLPMCVAHLVTWQLQIDVCSEVDATYIDYSKGGGYLVSNTPLSHLLTSAILRVDDPLRVIGQGVTCSSHACTSVDVELLLVR